MSIVKLVLVFCLACIPGSYLNAFGDHPDVVLCEDGRVSFVTEPFPEFVVNYDEVDKTFLIEIVPSHDDLELLVVFARISYVDSSISFPLDFEIVEDIASSYVAIQGDEEDWALAIDAYYSPGICGPSVPVSYTHLTLPTKA